MTSFTTYIESGRSRTILSNEFPFEIQKGSPKPGVIHALGTATRSTASSTRRACGPRGAEDGYKSQEDWKGRHIATLGYLLLGILFKRHYVGIDQPAGRKEIDSAWIEFFAIPPEQFLRLTLTVCVSSNRYSECPTHRCVMVERSSQIAPD